MQRKFFMMMLLLMFIGVVLPTTTVQAALEQAAVSDNLMTNPGAEETNGFNAPAIGWSSLGSASWSTVAEGQKHLYPQRGALMFGCNPNSSGNISGVFARSDMMTQTVDISKWRNFIDSGEQNFRFSGYYAADNGDDSGMFRVQVDNGSGDMTSVMQTFSSDEYHGLTWKLYSLNEPLPKNARKIQVACIANKSAGHNYHAAHFDNMSVTLPIYRIPYTVTKTEIAKGATAVITIQLATRVGITFKSLNPAIATVDANGVIKGVKGGLATIQINDPGLPEASVSFTVTITEPVPTVVVTPPESSASLALNKSSYTSGETITLNITGYSGSGYLFMTKAGAEYSTSSAVAGVSSQHSNYTEYFKAPIIEGPYELRYHTDADHPTPSNLIAKATFMVATPKAPVPDDTPVLPDDTPVLPDDTPAQPDVLADRNTLTAEAIDSGVRLEWPAARGRHFYRLFRSEVPGEAGISVTDFGVTASNYIDVNVEPNTQYYYTVRQIIADADPWNDKPEELGRPSRVVSVTTKDVVLEPEGVGEKIFIMMKIDDPMMSVNGLAQEIDPGRGTSPVIRSGRVLVPIRMIIESMNGTASWDDATRAIALDVSNHIVVMWLDKKEITVDGLVKTIDVAPVSINDRTMVPVRFAVENTGARIEWLNTTNEIIIVFTLY